MAATPHGQSFAQSMIPLVSDLVPLTEMDKITGVNGVLVLLGVFGAGLVDVMIMIVIVILSLCKNHHYFQKSQIMIITKFINQ